ncbi:DNA cytosine methyltransferase [Pseudomonas sp. W5-01]|uniref:DNA cytosine methyltransferase n=1 Tax=Pseudomonas sp. W5-01 TaxID=3097454 RepID=UPI00397A64C1
MSHDIATEGLMNLAEPIQIVDLFAGPGGLGEGFSSFLGGRRFKIIASAEMDPVAHQTLKLRAFFRILKQKGEGFLADYYNYCNGLTPQPWTDATMTEWEMADLEARCITLGTKSGDDTLDEILDKQLDQTKPWVLIGGPPCQAYSVVGRSRNMGKANYTPEEDHRHFLYRDYLRIIQERQPTIFVMENVKGILSAKINGESIFSKILEDLADPDRALGVAGAGKKYRICSLVSDQVFDAENSFDIDPREYIIRSEQYGIPQARHRVILLGVAIDAARPIPSYEKLPRVSELVSTKTVIGHLPKIRSRLTKQVDSDSQWMKVVMVQFELIAAGLACTPELSDMLKTLKKFQRYFSSSKLSVGSLRVERSDGDGFIDGGALDDWFLDRNLTCWLNHDARGHMASDLMRYLYASIFAAHKGYSPKGHREFNLPGLAPAHKNWESGKFSDRFRVQCSNNPSRTITSHISKDGHYFIHYDPAQCRSLSVREAARLQTFPDNYFFEGNRSQQYHQVGNAVPPLLASKIDSIVSQLVAAAVDDVSSTLNISPLEELEVEA